MEDIHGVDVSWLHHSNRDKQNGIPATTPPAPAKDAPLPPPPLHTPPHLSHHNTMTNRDDQVAYTVAPKNTNVKQTAPPAPPLPASTSVKPTPRRPNILGRTSSEKINFHSSPENGNRSFPRRTSWMSNISSKFASPLLQQSHHSSPQANGNATAQKERPMAPAPVAKSQIGTESEVREELEPYVPAAPRAVNASFFSNALRRLSSNTTIGTNGKASPKTSMCPRRVLNIDPNRPRCLLPELDASKLRRVAFCVDVEIAGGPRYKDEIDSREKKKKLEEKKLDVVGEGEALKQHPEHIIDDQEATDVRKSTDEAPSIEENSDQEGTSLTDEQSMRRKEKKKKSEEERKERKEQRRKRAEESGAVPVQIVLDPNESTQSLLLGSSAPRPTDRPTTDPLRIYRRCCQLRESPVLKRITEQLSRPTVCPASFPGVVSCLDLTGSRLQFADVMTVSDWLAIVPVKKLILEDSDLTDEGVRVLLAGLLAARDVNRPRRHGRTRSDLSGKPEEERAGLVEKLSLKNNPKITKEGWKHISLFVHMCKSLKALDVSMLTFPQSTSLHKPVSNGPLKPNHSDPAELFSKAIAERLGGDRLEELVMAECALTADDIRKLVDGISISGLKRLGLAGNNLDACGIDHVVRYIRSGVCEGIDLGGNDMSNHIERLGEAFHEKLSLWALSLADCNLTPVSLKPLFPSLLKLSTLRFLDLSHNHDLFSKQPSAIGQLRKYLPQLLHLKRLHLLDVSMTPAQAIALAEVLPECTSLAHLNILQNPQLSALASATDEEMQEEACALYASLMAAARVSHTLICVDIDVPTSDNSEIVKALAKQVVAYCLRNMEHFAALEAPDAGEAIAAALDAQADIDVPEVLLHLVGSYGGNSDLQPVEAAPNIDYIVGGTGVVKALSYCLSEKASEVRRGSFATSGASTPRESDDDHSHVLSAAKAKQMSKNLLEGARAIRSRLQPALVREAKAADDLSYRRLLFLDNTLQGMIQRFEDEYPECRVTPSVVIAATTSTKEEDASSSLSSDATASYTLHSTLLTNSDSVTLHGSDSEEEVENTVGRVRLSRHNSDVSIAVRALSKEEGHVHRLGVQVHRELLSPANGAAGADQDPDTEPEHMQALRAKLAALDAEEIRDAVVTEGWEKTADGVVEMGAELKKSRRSDAGELVRLRDHFIELGVDQDGSALLDDVDCFGNKL